MRFLLFATSLLVVLLSAAVPAGAREAVEPPAPVATVYPVIGKVHYGGFANRFGGGRSHRGHDVFADCGTPLVAAAPGTVLESKSDGSAGNYVVIRAEDGRSHVYMHLRHPSPVAAGETVEAGRRLGSVGDSGNAWDCHLHFEIWTAPGWYRGGHPIDPLPFLKSLTRV